MIESDSLTSRKSSSLSIGLILILVINVVSACTWVKPTESGVEITVTEASQVAHCRKVSTLTTSVKHNIGSMQRNAEKVRTELLTLGRNEAAIRGGDTIVPRGEVEGGSMTFDVYQCD
jgi:hypothetical protein